jgi:hypothetical protein
MCSCAQRIDFIDLRGAVLVFMEETMAEAGFSQESIALEHISVRVPYGALVTWAALPTGSFTIHPHDPPVQWYR